ncbi:hypothetical protein NEOC65_002094 [Neochlamydia sp. AcF65]|nr:hypothetical protein [Neochlamydia sp. AcF65]MBS4170409.1 hypothetical protein [Neochlamydia sp. AcF95]NGY95377.1 hypothetical protein [Neochlamydia sp. AcF84]
MEIYVACKNGSLKIKKKLETLFKEFNQKIEDRLALKIIEMLTIKSERGITIYKIR